MGLFVAENGQYHGWLAAVLCCFGAVNDDESPIERRKDRELDHAHHHQHGIRIEQPSSSKPPSSLNAPTGISSYSADSTTAGPVLDDSFSQAYGPSGAANSYQSSGPSSRRGLNPRQPTDNHDQRPLISAPASFRRIELTPEQRQALVPLRLGPVVLRDAPAADPNIPRLDSSCLEASAGHQLTPSEPAAYHQWIASHASANESGGRDDLVIPGHKEPTPSSRSPASTVTTERQRTLTGPSELSRSSSRSSQPPRRSFSNSSGPSMPSIEYLRPKQRKSFSSFRWYPEDEDTDVEREVNELNTIVEERRGEARRTETPTEHIPAVAPNMEVRARSQTLTEIGSALSLPRSSRAANTTGSRASLPPLPSSSHSINRTTSKYRHRVSGWLSGILTSSNSSSSLRQEPFYRCQIPTPAHTPAHARENSEGSFGTIESPSLTAASSPTTKGHSRSQTEESHVLATPSSFGGRYVSTDTQAKTKGKTAPVFAEWSNVELSQVGLAL